MKKSKTNGDVQTVVLTHAKYEPNKESILQLIELMDKASTLGVKKVKSMPK